jgi:hypothetical protein
MMRTPELALIDDLRRQCMATQFRLCLDELVKLAGTCRSLARTPAGRTRSSSLYFKLATQLDADVVRLRDLLNDGMDSTAPDAGARNSSRVRRDPGTTRRARSA